MNCLGIIKDIENEFCVRQDSESSYLKTKDVDLMWQ